MSDLVFPSALRIASKTFADRPKIVGEILVALCTTRKVRLSEVQEYILAECREEIAERLERRAKDAERKRMQRNGGAK